MNRLLAFLLAAAATGAAVPARANPLYFTFSGQVTALNDAGGVSGLVLGSPVTYNFLVDFAGQGSATQFGNTIVYQDVADGFYDSFLRYSADYFRVDYVSGDALNLPWTGSPYRENMGQALTIWDRFDPSYVYYYGYLNGSVQTDFHNVLTMARVLFQDPSALPFNWQEGTTVLGIDRLLGSGGYVEVQSSLTLARISEVAPSAVPEPGSLLLVGCGLLAVTVLRRSC